MRNYKKLLAILMATLLIITALAGCGNDSKIKQPDINDTPKVTESKLPKDMSNDRLDKEGGIKETEVPKDTESPAETEGVVPEKPVVPDTSRKNEWRTDTTEEAPAKLGEFVMIPSYYGTEEPVGVCVNKITHGEEAYNTVKEYVNGENSVYKWSEPEDGLEWALLDITVDISKLTIADYGKSISYSDLGLQTVGSQTLHNADGAFLTSAKIVVSGDVDIKQGDKKADLVVAVMQFSDNMDNPVIKVGGLTDAPQYVEFN